MTGEDEKAPREATTGPVFEVLTLFPDLVAGFASVGLIGKARERGLVAVHCTDIREFCTDPHRSADDAPFGGGPGMVMKIEPIVAALEAVEEKRGSMHRVLLSPAAPLFDQRVAERLARQPRLGLICGRYEGVDDRVRTHFVDECLSIGDFVLGGGEVAAMAIIEAVTRLCPKVLGNPESVQSESFARRSQGALLEYPQYTRPASFRDHDVPSVLLGGNHAKIARWREAEALRRTRAVRPDLRPSSGLPSDVPVYLALSAECESAVLDEVGELARRREVAGLLALGPGAEARAIPWARALGGRVQVAAFSGLAALRRRLQRSHRMPPAVIALVDQGGPDAVRDPGELVDRAFGGGEAGSLVLWVDGTPAEEVDAVFALSPLKGAEEGPHPGLAPGAVMEDASPLRTPGPAKLAGRALTALGR